MYKVINGKGYNTETAQELAVYEANCGPKDFKYVCETLYRKKTGEYFLHGNGGAMTKYRESTGSNSWSGGEAITPMSIAEAKKWAEEHCNGDKYEAIFGSVEETEDVEMSERMHLLLPVTITDALRKRKEATGTTVTALVIEALRKAGY